MPSGSKNGTAITRKVDVTRHAAPGSVALPHFDRDGWAGFVGAIDPNAKSPTLDTVTVEDE